ncbi:MAG: fimbrillin family protein [Candidatus Cryptobacteroides sp.]
MKKNLFLAALAGVALVGCAKNEVAQVTDDSQREITFAAPVMSVTTKTQEITGTTYPTDAPTFGVFGWYVAGNTYDSSTAQAYMSNAEMSYDSSFDDTEDTGNGRWISNPVYYWPKQGTITFDAYSPYSVASKVTCDKTYGLKFNDFEVTNVLANQVDLMFAKRAYDKSSSKGTSVSEYDGVDIVFNHALSVVKFTVKTAADYSGTTQIAVRTIKIIDALDEATFYQNVADDRSENPVWGDYGATTSDYVSHDVFKVLTTTVADAESTVIVLPQSFSAGAKLDIEYYIKTGVSAWIPQNKTIALSESGFEYKEGGSVVTVSGWEIGKRYTYNIAIGLNEIYFAPSVTDWKDVDVTVPTI